MQAGEAQAEGSEFTAGWRTMVWMWPGERTDHGICGVWVKQAASAPEGFKGRGT